MMYRATVLVLCACALVAGAQAQCFEKDDSATPADANSRQALYRGQQVFTLNLFNAINKVVPDDNIFFSPFSVYHALLLAYFSSAGQTETDLKQSLQLAEQMNKKNVMLSYVVDKNSREANNQSDSYEFTSANRLFADKGLDVRACMLEFFGSELETLNFREQPVESRNYINDWVAKVTKKHIEDLLPADGITTATRLVLANAAYFKGVWASKFLSERTKKEPFYVSDTRQTFVPFMKQKGTFHYMSNEELGAQILELPYKGNDISMYIFLPPYSMKEGVTNIIAKLTPERLAAVVEESYMGREVIVEIPKFTMERELPLRHILETMGVGDLFNSSADFTTLSSQRGVMFDDAVHKAKIQINEEGTVAAAATAIFGFRSSRPAEPTHFIANFPFVYIIYEKPTSSVLFMGVYRDPKK